MPYWRIGAVGAGLVAVVLATGGNGPATDGTIELASRGTPASHGGTFSVRARPVTGLYPGVVKPMVVTLRNPYDFDLRVTTLGGKVTDSSRRSCRPGGRTVSARPYAGRLPVVVPARSTREVGAVPIAMSPEAPERCRRTTFEVLVTGRATRVAR
ncbi:hypothetical protein [Actinoplanes sp. RD1]|uniref:hypothetical protein n=1 Tax=Actinoplanes sp. RD1 TaxID=3064538 RepID=UPI002741E3F3|nr:hypothetical protein [Actinoplanes sp. RD1]